MANHVVVIMWRDIPAQVNAQAGRQRVQVPLSDKFERAIDMAKRKGKIVTAHEDVAQWHRVTLPCGDDLAAGANAEAARLEVEFPKDRLGKIAFRGVRKRFADHFGNREPEHAVP